MYKMRSVGTTNRILRSSFASGFTLVELLIVVAIIAVLAAVLLPVFVQARESGRRATCQGNLRQIAVAMHQYVQDYDGVYPHEMFVYHDGGVSTEVLWHEVLFPYTKNHALFVCPSQGKPVPRVGNPGDGYNYNDDRLNNFRWSGPDVTKAKLTVQGKHESEFINPSTVWLNGDRVAIENHQCVDCGSGRGTCGRDFYGGTVHNKGGNYSFLDGHVKWFTLNAIAEVDCQNPRLPNEPPPAPGE